MSRSTGRRVLRPPLAALGLIVVVSMLLGGCADAPQNAAGADDGFTASIDTVYGTVDIEGTPQRIAVLAPGDADILLALGLQPESVVPFATPGLETAWNKDYVGYGPTDLTPAARDVMAVKEQVAAMAPDVIFAINTIIEEQAYREYSKLAPTIVRSGDYPVLSEPWQDSARTIARAVNKAAEAEDLIADAQSKIEATAAEHPEFAGKTGAVIWPADPGRVAVYSPKDSRGATLTALGLHQPPEVLEVSDPDAPDKWGGEISYENLSVLDGVDYLVVLDGPQAGQLRSSAVFSALPAVAEGRVAYLDEEQSGGMAVATVLSQPWIVDQLADALAS